MRTMGVGRTAEEAVDRAIERYNGKQKKGEAIYSGSGPHPTLSKHSLSD